MMTLLREVLTVFEQAEGPLRLSDLAERLNVSPGVLEGMIEFWVRKGRMRMVAGCPINCGTCPADDCLLKTLRLPARYELTRDR